MLNKFRSQKGFTLVELGVVFGVMAIIFGFSVFNFTSVQRIVNVDSATETIVSDLKNQQTKAMSGFTPEGSEANHGIYFSNDSYVLFRGSSYSQSNSTNHNVALGSNLEFSDVTFQGSTIIFMSKSGEIADYSEGSDSFSIQKIGGSNKQTIRLNKYGVITQIN
jgi:type II secretory pathway pseudopilin PulG